MHIETLVDVKVHHHVTDLLIGLQILVGDVDTALREVGVDVGHDTGLISVNVQKPIGAEMRRQ